MVLMVMAVVVLVVVVVVLLIMMVMLGRKSETEPLCMWEGPEDQHLLGSPRSPASPTSESCPDPDDLPGAPSPPPRDSSQENALLRTKGAA